MNWKLDDEVKESVSIEEMTNLIKGLVESKREYEAAKKVATEANDAYQMKRDYVLQVLQAQGLDKFEAPGVALVYTTQKEVYRVPQTNEDKRKLFDYIKSKYGEEVLTTMTGINHMTLNGWANRETESGEVMSIPGLESPTVEFNIGIRGK